MAIQPGPSTTLSPTIASRQGRTADARLRIEYERVGRHSAPDLLRLEIAPAAATDSSVRVWFDRAYIHGRSIESIAPEPEQLTASGDRIIYEFRLADPTQRAVIAFETNPRDMGRQRAAVGLVGGDSLRFTQLILP